MLKINFIHDLGRRDFCGRKVRQIGPNLPEVVGAKNLPGNTPFRHALNRGAMLWCEWTDAICPRGDIAQIAVPQCICEREVGSELFYGEVGPDLEWVFFVVHSVSLMCLDIDVKPN